MYAAHPTKATTAAIIVAPGGGFTILAWENEGVRIAEWFVQQGVTAFVLKYRLPDTGETEADFRAWAASIFSGQSRPAGWDEHAAEVRAQAVEDGRQAVRLIRARGGEWGIDPTRVGMIGFSAGAFLATAVATSDESTARPDFVVPVYGGAAETVPADAPPLFAVAATDDPLGLATCVAITQAWLQAQRPAELHLYEKGGHGFGARKQGLPIDGWIDRLRDWMQAHELVP